jgi:signal transduction histidine kinase
MTGSAFPAPALAWPPRLFRRWLPLLMLLSLAGGLLGAYRLALSLGEPFPGFVLLWRKEYRVFTVSWVTPPYWSGPVAGVMINDRILCIDGYTPNPGVYGLDPRYAQYPCPNGQKNYAVIFRELNQTGIHNVDFFIDRAGKLMTIPNVPLVPFTFGMLLETFFPSFLLGLVLLGLGYVVFRANPGFEINLVFGLLMLASSNFAFNNALAGHITDRQFNTGWITMLQIVPWFPLMGALIFHMITLLSSPGPLSAAARVILRPYYLLSWAILIIGETVFLFNSVPALMPLMWVYLISAILSCIFSLGWSLVSLILAYKRTEQLQVHRQTGLVLAAFVLGILICLPFAGLLFANYLAFPYMQGLPYAALVVLAIIAYAILRYQLFAARTQILTLLLVLVVSVVVALIVYLPIARQIGFVPLLGSSVLAGSVFAGRFKPLGFLDRLLHREEMDFQVVERFDQRIGQAQGIEQLARTAIQALKDELETGRVNLWLLDPDQPVLEYYVENRPVETLAWNPALASQVLQTAGPVYANSATAQGFVSNVPEGLRLHPGGLWVPIRERDQAFGLLYLGPRWTGEVFSEDDLRLVWLLTAQLGLAFGNLRQMERLQAVQRLILQAEENERYKIARELHDTILQFLQALTFGLDSIKNNPARLSKRVEDWQGRISSESSHLRDLLGYLRTPETLERRGLPASLEALFGAMRAQTSTLVTWDLDPLVDAALPTEAKVALYRVLREAVQNAVKHACAKQITIRLEKKEERVIFTIRDDGKGFDIRAAYAATTKGYNSLQDMRIYVESTGGQFEIKSAPDAGTLIQGWTPTLPTLPS